MSELSYTYNLTGQLSGTGGNAFAQEKLTRGTFNGDFIFLVGAGFTFPTENKVLAETGTLRTWSLCHFHRPKRLMATPFSRPGNGSAKFQFPSAASWRADADAFPWHSMEQRCRRFISHCHELGPSDGPGEQTTRRCSVWQTVYSVDVGTATTERLEIRNGDVTFTNANYNVAATAFDPAGILLDNTILTLNGASVLSGAHALIGESAAARVDVITGGLNLLRQPASRWAGQWYSGCRRWRYCPQWRRPDRNRSRWRDGRRYRGPVRAGAAEIWRLATAAMELLTISDGGSVLSAMGFVGFWTGYHRHRYDSGVRNLRRFLIPQPGR